MHRYDRIARILALVVVVSCVGRFAHAQQSSPEIAAVLKTLNDHDSVKTTEDNKSYKLIWDAYLKLTQPPMPVGPEFNLNTIHPKMSQWPAVAGWAESNSGMGQAIRKARDKIVFGLPYGTEKVDPNYVKANLTALVGVDGVLRDIRFPYQSAIETIEAYVAAEVYRLMEAGQIQPAIDLAVANCFFMRQLCDREFLDEKLHAIEILSDALGSFRDVMYLYEDKITAVQYTDIAKKELPYLRPDRSRLFMPEADRVISQAIIEDVFDPKSNKPEVDKFTATFAEIQSKDAPLTRFGAAKRWRNIAEVHGSREASLERLKLIYDDWWRRWRVQEYDEILSFDTQFERTNPIRYAAVIYSMQDVESLFQVRNRLIVEVNGTVASAGLAAYKKTFGVYPDQLEKCYTQFMPKRSDADPYDKAHGVFIYFPVSSSRVSIDTSAGRVWIDPADKQCILLSLGQDHEDHRGAQHSDDGAHSGDDIVVWPPITALEREQGLIP